MRVARNALARECNVAASYTYRSPGFLEAQVRQRIVERPDVCRATLQEGAEDDGARSWGRSRVLEPHDERLFVGVCVDCWRGKRRGVRATRESEAKGGGRWGISEATGVSERRSGPRSGGGAEKRRVRGETRGYSGAWHTVQCVVVYRKGLLDAFVEGAAREGELHSGGRRLLDTFVEGAAREGRPRVRGGGWRMRL